MAKPFTWTQTKLKQYESCPLKYYEVDVLKKYADLNQEQLAAGNFFHDNMAKSMKTGADLPPELKDYQHWVKRLRPAPGLTFVEEDCKFGLTRDLVSTGFFAPNVWYRGIGDLLKVLPTVARIWDWKTGNIPKMGIDVVQLMLLAMCVFSKYPQVQTVVASFVWIKELDEQGRFGLETPETFRRDEMPDNMVGVLERVRVLEEATKKNLWPARQNGLCFKYCPVVTCSFNGRRRA